MITLHHLENSRSQRILWLLEELQLPYRIQRYQRNATTLLAPPELKAVHPLGKSPVISDGDITVAESGAIIEYLAERYGDWLLPPAGRSHQSARLLKRLSGTRKSRCWMWPGASARTLSPSIAVAWTTAARSTSTPP